MRFNSKPAFFSSHESGIICKLCSHYCILHNGRTGICGVNKNEGGILKTIVYGYPSAIHIDPIEKKPLYHFLPGSTSLSLGTIGCNMQCPFCQNWHISQNKSLDAKQNYVSQEDIVFSAINNKCKSISYTYNEPTVFYPYARDIAIIAKESGIKNAFVTNGIASKEVIRDMKGLIDACNVDLKSSQPEFYKKLLKAPFVVFESLKLLRKLGIWLEITTLIVPGENDNKQILGEISAFIVSDLGDEIPWHISAFHPEYKMLDKSRTSKNSLMSAYEIGLDKGLKHIYIGNSGLPNPTICPKCNATVIERNSYSVYDHFKIEGICPECNYTIPGIWT